MSARRATAAAYGFATLVGLFACQNPERARPSALAAPPSTAARRATPPATPLPSGPDAGAEQASVEPSAADLEPDGDDDVAPEDDARVSGRAPAPLGAGRFDRVGRAPLSLQRICDLTPLADALYAAHATRPLGLDGASVTRYRPSDPKPFSVAFDWNRAGEATKGGGAGQGFLRVHAIGGRLFVTDADPPYNGFGISEPGTEGYVFVSTANGEFARARMPGHLPPKPPDAEHAGAAVLPRAYHVIDAIRFRGQLYAATGSVPPGQRAWHGASPGALQVEKELGARFAYAADYPNPYQAGVWRLTFLVRFHGRLYAGIQDYDQREPNDYVYFTLPNSRSTIQQGDLHAVRVTEAGTAQTLRWYADRGQLYWIAWNHEGVALRVSKDGDTWRVVPLPADLGVPTDITRYRGVLVVQMSRGLVCLADSEPGYTVLARVTDKKSPFDLDDSFCAAPLAVFQGALYAGGQRDGALFRFHEGE
jgi:hypothetical protein